MKIRNSFLDLYSDNINYTDSMGEFGKDCPFTLQSTQSLDIGFYKPIRQIYVEVKTANTNSSVISIQKWNGSSWVDINIMDKTSGFKQSGFIYFDEDNLATSTTLNSQTKFWLRLKVSSNTSAMILSGINLVWCGLEDMLIEEPSLEKFYPNNSGTHIKAMVSATKHVLRMINNSQPGYVYKAGINPLIPNSDLLIETRNMTQWDLYDISEASDFVADFAIAKTYQNRIDRGGTDEVFKEKMQQYLDSGNLKFALFRGTKLTLDMNDDGKKTPDQEYNSVRTVKMYR